MLALHIYTTVTVRGREKQAPPLIRGSAVAIYTTQQQARHQKVDPKMKNSPFYFSLFIFGNILYIFHSSLNNWRNRLQSAIPSSTVSFSFCFSSPGLTLIFES